MSSSHGITSTGATRMLVALVIAVFGYSLMQTVVVPALGLLTRERG